MVWVGFDDNRDFKLEGAHSALPIWAEFMKHAHQHREYRNVHPFDAPDGIVTVEIDAETGQLATPQCPKMRSQAFIAGTQPVETCHLHGGGTNTQVAGWETTPAPAGSASPVAPAAAGEVATPASAPPVVASAPPSRRKAQAQSIPITPPDAPQPPRKKKGFFGRLKDVFKN